MSLAVALTRLRNFLEVIVEHSDCCSDLYIEEERAEAQADSRAALEQLATVAAALQRMPCGHPRACLDTEYPSVDCTACVVQAAQVQQAVRLEREACARACEDVGGRHHASVLLAAGAGKCAAAIRARGGGR